MQMRAAFIHYCELHPNTHHLMVVLLSPVLRKLLIASFARSGQFPEIPSGKFIAPDQGLAKDSRDIYKVDHLV